MTILLAWETDNKQTGERERERVWMWVCLEKAEMSILWSWQFKRELVSFVVVNVYKHDV